MVKLPFSPFNFKLPFVNSMGVIAILCLTACGSKKEYTPEQELAIAYTHCFYGAFEDEGASLKNSVGKYEDLLIEEGIIEDATGASYVALFEEIIARDSLIFKPTKDYTEFYNEVQKPNDTKALLCSEQFKLGEKFERSIEHSNLLGDWTPATFAQGILSEFTADDFDLIFYKMSFFFMFDTINYENVSGIRRDLPVSE